MKKAMLFAAGLGTRLYPITKDRPKALAEVNGITLLERNIEYLKSFGFDEIVINLHHFAESVKDFLKEKNNFDIQIDISDESDELLETGGGLVKARHFFDDDFLVMNVDILTDLKLNEFIQHHVENQSLATLAVSNRISSRKLLFDDNMQLRGWKNLQTGEKIIDGEGPYKELAFSGIHIIKPEIFDKMPENGKFSIMTTYMDLMPKEPIFGYDHSGGKLIDVGKLEAIKQAEKLFR